MDGTGSQEGEVAVKAGKDDAASRLQQLMKATGARYTTAGDLAHSVLREAILRGVLEPGEQLRQDTLAEALGMSRIPVRSALFQLESDGLVEVRPNRGAVVKIHTPKELYEIYEARIVLETYAVRKAVEMITSERLKRLERLAVRLDRVEPGDAFVDAGLAFYRELYSPVNGVIADLSERLRSDVGRYWLRPRVTHGHEQTHLKLVQMVADGDSDGAAAWIERHLREVAERVVAMLETRGSDLA